MLPYKIEGGGNPIRNENQLPQDDSETINQYFHNPRVGETGILKGMVRFSVTTPWQSLKDMRSPYFNWLYNNRVYLKHTSFDADSIVLLGYLQGAHPDAVRLADLTKEFKERLNLEEGVDVHFSPRNLTVTDSQVTKTKFGFRALAVDPEGVTSYRSELGGITAILYIFQQIVLHLDITSGSVMLYCDNKGALENVFNEQPKRGIYPLLERDYDMLGAARAIRRDIPIKVTGKWVKGHYKGNNREIQHDLNLRTSCFPYSRMYLPLVEFVFPVSKHRNLPLLV